MGLFETFCFICAGTFHDDYFDKNDEEKKLKYGKWLTNIHITTRTENTIKINNVHEDYDGEFEHKGKLHLVTPPRWNTPQPGWDEKDIHYSTVCHQSCYKLIHKFLKYKIKFADTYYELYYTGGILEPLSKYGPMKKYSGGQFFDFDKYITTPEDHWLLKDPLSNTKNKNRILKIWKPLVKMFIKYPPGPAPLESAGDFKKGKILQGYDGNMWKVIITKNKKRIWVREKNKTSKKQIKKISKHGGSYKIIQKSDYDYYHKYLKYKTKYINYKKQIEEG